MTQCPKGCDLDLPQEEMLRHLTTYHRTPSEQAKRLLGIGGRGWEEAQDPERKVAPRHSDVAKKAQILKAQESALNIPVVTFEAEKVVKAPEGWVKTPHGYDFLKVIYEKQGADYLTKQTMHGEVFTNYMKAEIITATKDISELEKLKHEHRLLSARLAEYTLSDPEFSGIAARLYELQQGIESLSKSLQAEIDTELVMEEHYSGLEGSDENKEWMSAQMKRVSEEAERLIKYYKNQKAQTV